MDIEGAIVDVPVDDVPEPIRRTCPEFEIDPKRLWGLSLRAQPILIDTVAWMLELPVWPEHGKPFILRPIDVIRSPEQHPEHAARIRRSSLSFPIDVVPYRKRLVILEGCHRTSKAVNEGRSTILARIVPPHRIPEIVDWNATVPTFGLQRFMKKEYNIDV